MLASLHISNYALIDSLDVEFTSGLNIITGETGAGKSIMLGALGVLLGGRAELRMVRHADRKSVIEATFTGIAHNADLKEIIADIEVDWDDEKLILRRELSATSGRTRAFVNDTPVSVNDLQKVAIHLVDIHSQHQNLLLASPAYQLEIIDALAGNAELLASYKDAYNTLKKAVQAFQTAREELKMARAREEFLRHQYQQLKEANLSDPDEIEKLEKEQNLASNQAVIQESVSLATKALSDEENSVYTLLRTAGNSIDHLTSLVNDDPEVGELQRRLESARIEIADIAATLEGYATDSEVNPRRLEQIDDRLGRLYQLLRLHKTETLAQLIDTRNKLSKDLRAIDSGDEDLRQLQSQARNAKTAAEKIAFQITQSRIQTAEKFATELKSRAMPLGMSNLQVKIDIKPQKLGPSGADEIAFLFAFNKNQPLLPVGGTASGGEISRLMLTIKSIIADKIQLPTIVFDEVDTGVSGDVANRMALMMQQIARDIQVIAITHLPQVAAKGDTHFKVYKEDTDSETITSIRCLDHDERVAEVALMLSGDAKEKTAVEAACTLLNLKKDHPND